MTEFEVVLLSAGVASILSLAGALLHSYILKRLERRQQVWQTEINRIIELEEHAGELVEFIGSHKSIEEIRQYAAKELPRLESCAGRFRRHKGIMQAVRNLYNKLGCLLKDKERNVDFRAAADDVSTMYDKLLVECDKVTGKRRI